MPEIDLNGKKIQYEVSVRRVRYVRIYIAPEGKLYIVSPTRRVERFLKEKEDWILSKLEKIERAKNIQGFPYLGKFYPFKDGKIFTDNKVLDVSDKRKLEKTLKNELRTLLVSLVEERAASLGVKPKRIFIRKQRTRWGSCSPKGNLSFNLAMLALPPELIDYLVTHEVTHLIEMNHSKRFWTLVEEFHPDWRKKRKELKDWWIIVHNNPIWREILGGRE
ncbi:M48 family metallopeptidase [Thermococcus alcaliphilus]|uniref:M48 family metallopeptidase n=1 Tax=Thermococcus alcaliphilus TaxID=139207 RepID=UPI002091ABEE|nr:SprT family zinc-dependent metalloprotease [Thermococcus alcaliphilus]MCO6041006.1 M48 family metallopeptidase [Thermococcus alcaliphilus]